MRDQIAIEFVISNKIFHKIFQSSELNIHMDPLMRLWEQARERSDEKWEKYATQNQLFNF